VLVNVMANAADAIDGRRTGASTITAERAGRRACASSRARLRPGVPAALRERIFDPFFSTKGVGKRAGAGLSISYNIIKDFGGDLSVVEPEAAAPSSASTCAPPTEESRAA
jgi:two-component system, NtrC family, C4-dicarboxylate transport sensor histidine kinase DctB